MECRWGMDKLPCVMNFVYCLFFLLSCLLILFFDDSDGTWFALRFDQDIIIAVVYRSMRLACLSLSSRCITIKKNPKEHSPWVDERSHSSDTVGLIYQLCPNHRLFFSSTSNGGLVVRGPKESEDCTLRTSRTELAITHFLRNWTIQLTLYFPSAKIIFQLFSVWNLPMTGDSDNFTQYISNYHRLAA